MKFSREFLVVSLLVIAGIVMISLRYYRVNAKTADSQANDGSGLSSAFQALDDTMGGPETPITVEAEPVRRGDLVQRVSAQGRVHGYQNTDVSCEVSGRLDSLFVKDGQRVKKGDLLALIDDRDYRLALEDAKAKSLSAKADYLTFDLGQRDQVANVTSDQSHVLSDLKRQHEAGTLSNEAYRQQVFMLELEQMRTGQRREDVIAARTLEQARIAEQRAQLSLDKCRVLAPFDGTVFNVMVAPGVFLNTQTALLKLVNLDDLAVKAKVLESEIGAIEPGRTVKIRFAALPSLGAVAGKVDAISPFVNVADKTVDVVIRFPNDQGLVKPGMFAEVDIDSRIYQDRLMVPKTAILPRDNRLVVFKVSADNRAKWEYVETGVENDQFVEIVKGNLNEGNLVLTDNHFTMGHDTLVDVGN